jgi:hypothetical protein
VQSIRQTGDPGDGCPPPAPRLNRLLWAESGAQICTRSRPTHHAFWLAFLGCFPILTTSLHTNSVNAFDCRIEDRLPRSGIFSSEHELKACLAFLFPDNQQESREDPKLFDAGSKIVRFDPAILSWRFRRVPYIQSLDLLQTSNAAIRDSPGLKRTRRWVSPASRRLDRFSLGGIQRSDLTCASCFNACLILSFPYNH